MKWDSGIVDYAGADFSAGMADGRSGVDAAPGTRNGVAFASYMEGWLMGSCEIDAGITNNEADT